MGYKKQTKICIVTSNEHYIYFNVKLIISLII